MNRVDIPKKKINLHFFRTLVIKRPVIPTREIIPETYPEKLNRFEIISKFLIAERRIGNEACLVKLILSRLIFVLSFPIAPIKIPRDSSSLIDRSSKNDQPSGFEVCNSFICLVEQIIILQFAKYEGISLCCCNV